MSSAEKRTWWTFGISLATVLIGVGASVFVWANELDVFQAVLSRGLGVPFAIPLIAMVVLGRRFPDKEYDERDIHIERNGLSWGLMAGMSFLTGLSLLLCVLDPRGSISTVTVPFIAYLAFFVVTLFGSGAGLFQYRGTEKGGGDG